MLRLASAGGCCLPTWIRCAAWLTVWEIVSANAPTCRCPAALRSCQPESCPPAGSALREGRCSPLPHRRRDWRPTSSSRLSQTPLRRNCRGHRRRGDRRRLRRDRRRLRCDRPCLLRIRAVTIPRLRDHVPLPDCGSPPSWTRSGYGASHRSLRPAAGRWSRIVTEFVDAAIATAAP